MGFENESLKDKIKRSDELYKKLFENSPLIIILADFEGTIIDCNKNIEKLGEITREELV
ncbi:MAG: PAS domain S-box protein, partial [Candidatus Helarchaeota archaeon]